MQQLWQKAQDYFEASIALDASPNAYMALGTLLEQRGELSAASQCYKNGLTSAI
jgi:uncharacterized protein HemY